jgi:uncharacterized protein YkwD
VSCFTRCRHPERLLRHLLIGVVCCLVIGLLAPSVLAARIRTDPGLAGAIVSELNARRSAEKLPRLKASVRLARAALAQAVSMGQLGFFSHSSADGSSPIRRIESYYHGKGAAVGEVMYWAEGAASAARAIAWWLGSSTHRPQILSPRFREVGVGAVHVDDAPGYFGGRDVTLVVVDLGRRR